jgi:hypothetical protein
MPELLDAGDKDALQELLISPGYGLVRERIADTIQQLSTELESDLDAAVTAKVRGKIAGLRLALTVPDILIAEVRPEKRK